MTIQNLVISSLSENGWKGSAINMLVYNPPTDIV